MKRAKLIWIGGVFAVLLPVVWIGISQIFLKHRAVVATIDGLQSRDIERVLVYDRDWPSGTPRIVKDTKKIKLLVDSLKTGERYFPNHDQHNGFERVVFIEPQNLQFRVYQKEGDSDSIIVGLGEWKRNSNFRSFGDIKCALPRAWTQL